MRRIPTLLSFAVLACARGPATTSPTPAPPPFAETLRVTPIHPDELRRDLTVFAADSFRGREAGTPDAARAARFIAERLAQLGVEPAGDSGYFQRVPMTRTRLAPGATITVAEGGRATAIPVGVEGLVPIGTLGAGVPLPRLSAAGDLVFAGYALAGGEGRDDLTGLDLAGKVVVYVHGAPAALDSARRAGLTDQPLGERLGRLMARGPAAVVVLATGELAKEFGPFAAEMMSSMTLGHAEDTAASRVLPMLLIGTPRPGSLLLPAAWPADDRARPLRGRRLTARVDLKAEKVTGHNVVGVVRGSDAALRGTFVAFGAHLDHVGIQPGVNGDSIANGADDDGSGSMGILAIARALTGTSSKPRRSALFVWHTAEEKGLLGSAWFTEHPTVPLDSVVAQLNADMIGRNSPDSLYLVGARAAPNRQSSVLGAIVDSVNAALPRPFAVNREWDSPDHPERIYERSDHFNYAKHGIPVVFFTTGLHEDYHQVSDEVSKVDFDKLARVSNLMLQSGIAVASRVARPRP
ncbi:MAG: M28 family peptidase [Gemmatimonadota bacterium]|nr:M28 family peptidase [Gemmatimonadota bacterium]